MTQVIIYTNESGNVSVCAPTGELPIEEVLAKDCPEHAIIVDADSLPHADDDFFNAWRLTDGVISIDLEAARDIQLKRVNDAGVQEAQKRQLNTLSGLDNAVSDADFIAGLNAKRAAVAAATSTVELRAINFDNIGG